MFQNNIGLMMISVITNARYNCGLLSQDLLRNRVYPPIPSHKKAPCTLLIIQSPATNPNNSQSVQPFSFFVILAMSKRANVQKTISGESGMMYNPAVIPE
jgi:hypothetical protein